MSIDEGDPYTSAYSSARILQDVFTRKTPFSPSWLNEINDQLHLGLEIPEGTRLEAAQQLFGNISHKIQEREVDFYALQPFVEEALEVPEEKRTAFILRKKQIEKAMLDSDSRLLAYVHLLYGAEVFSNEGNRKIVQEAMKIPKKKVLQRLGVIDFDGKIVLGQEKFVPAWYSSTTTDAENGLSID